jgi:hypothetical protein
MKNGHPLRVAVLAAVCALNAGCVPHHPSTPLAPSSAEDDEVGVWHAVFAYMRSDASGQTLIVVDSAVTSEWQDEQPAPKAGELREMRLSVPTSSVQNLYRVSLVPTRLRSRAGDPNGVMWITRAEFGEYERAFHEGPKLMAARYPNAQRRVVAISRVGFDPRREYASLFALQWCGPLCASLNLIVLHRSAEGGWVVTGDAPLVVS